LIERQVGALAAEALSSIHAGLQATALGVGAGTLSVGLHTMLTFFNG
jgi:hypothetical protein